jgi:hypothetical protein
MVPGLHLPDERTDKPDVIAILFKCLAATEAGIPGEEPIARPSHTVGIYYDELFPVHVFVQLGHPYHPFRVPSVAV